MSTGDLKVGHRALAQQGYDYSPSELTELGWGLRFTPAVCMAFAVVGLVTQRPEIHFALAALGILPFWFPRAHPVDRLYNHFLRPLWKGVPLPPNPLPRRIACLMGGAMNLGIAVSFVAGNVPVAYAFGGVLIALQIVVITTHFCVASWMYEGLLRMLGRWTPPVSVERAQEILQTGSLVDVRSPEEFAREHLPGARNIPLETLVDELRGTEGESFVLYCQSGLRSQRGAQIMKRQGHRAVYSLGAMARWR